MNKKQCVMFAQWDVIELLRKMKYVRKCIELETVTQSEVSQAQKDM